MNIQSKYSYFIAKKTSMLINALQILLEKTVLDQKLILLHLKFL